MIDLDLETGWLAYREARLAQGLSHARELVGRFPQDGRAWYLCGCLFERSGLLRQADRCFARASRAAVEPCGLPCRVDARRFVAMIETAKRRLPPQLIEALGEVQIIVSDYPTLAQLVEVGESDLLGYFEGPTRAERADPGFGLQPTIWIFRRAHEHACPSMAALREEVARTFLHEFGHYLGFDEDDMVRFGLE